MAMSIFDTTSVVVLKQPHGIGQQLCRSKGPIVFRSNDVGDGRVGSLVTASRWSGSFVLTSTGTTEGGKQRRVQACAVGGVAGFRLDLIDVALDLGDIVVGIDGRVKWTLFPVAGFAVTQQL